MGADEQGLAGLDIAKQSVRGSLVLLLGNLASALLFAGAIFLIASYSGPKRMGNTRSL